MSPFIRRSASYAALALALISSVLLAQPAWAHKASDSYLTLTVTESSVTGRWDISLNDLAFVLNIDANRDREITWGEVRRRHDAIALYALERLRLSRGGTPCQLEPAAQRIARHADGADGAYTVLPFTAHCAARGAVQLTYAFGFDFDPTHRGLLRVESAGDIRQAVLGPASNTFELAAGAASAGHWRTFSDYWQSGVWHILHGFDHVLFLLSLLLPAVLLRKDNRWEPRTSFRETALDVTWVVTAFTVAHSITLALAVLGGLTLPGRLVESVIALTVILAGLHNLYPLFSTRRWVLGFGLGLVHGLGFAGALAGLELPAGQLVLALAAFNLGVESGQLALAALFLPAAFWCRHLALYRRGFLAFGSGVIALIGVFWLVERSLNVSLAPLFALALTQGDTNVSL